MAITVTVKHRLRGRATGTLNLGTYATGGVAVTPAKFGFETLTSLAVQPAGGYVFEWDEANAKIKAYRQKDPAATGGADIALPQVANSTDLSSVVAHFDASGF